MAARAGLTRADVVDAAVSLLAGRDDVGELTLAEVAGRVGVRTQSLYAHVAGLDGLRAELARRGLGELSATLTNAAIGRAGGDAVEAIVRAWIDFATSERALYQASVRRPDDAALADAMAETMRPLRLVLATYGLDDEEVGHWHRLIFSFVHGFASLANQGVLTLPGDPGDTIDRLVAVLRSQLEAQRRQP